MSQGLKAASGSMSVPTSLALSKSNSNSTTSASQLLTNPALHNAGIPTPSSGLLNPQTQTLGSSTLNAHHYRPLNVRDALSYLDQVKLQFQELPGVYNQFLDIMKDFKTQMIDTPGVIDGVSSLFRGHPALIQGFNTFLPPGYRIDVTQGEGPSQAGVNSVYNLITVTHPMGVQTQKRVPLQSGGEEIGSHILPDGATTSLPDGAAAPGPVPADKLTRDNINSLAFNHALPRTLTVNGPEISGPTSSTPGAAGMNTKPVTLDVVANHSLVPNRTNSPALSNTTSTDASKSTAKPLEFNHAITYVNKIKNRYSGDPKTYQTFLDILQTYQRDARPIQEVYEQVNHLFRDEPDLMVEFMQFLPDTSANASQPSLANQDGLLGVCNSAGVMSHDDRKNPPHQSNQSKPNNHDESTSGSQQPPVKRRRNGANNLAASKLSTPSTLRAPVLEANGLRQANTESDKLGASPSADPSSLRGTKRKQKTAAIQHPSESASIIASTTSLPPPGFAPPGYRSIGEAYHATLTSNSAAPADKRKNRDTLQPPASGQTRETRRNPPADANQIPKPKTVVAKEELIFFHHVKNYFANQTTYIEFLKIINLFTQDLIDLKTLVLKIKPFLNTCPELFSQFTDVVGWREDPSVVPSKRKGATNGQPESKKVCNRTALNTRPISSDSNNVSDCGPSYRQVPESDVTLACSGRDALCTDVLNDRWVCGPPSTSTDEPLFTPRQTNAFERALYQAEDERHEYDYHIEANVRTIALLEPINMRIQQMDPEHRAEHRLKPGLGGQSKSIYQRIIKKIYGKEHGAEVIQALHENPAVAVPIVLARLKQKDEEWKKALRDWNRVWREVDGKNYWKALDHQGISFKAVDKKMIGNKNLVNEIELIKRGQHQKRQLALDPSIIQLLPKYQLELDLSDTDVFYDVLKVFIHFLDHVPNSTGLDDAHKDRIESFLKSLLTSFFDIPLPELERHLTPLPPEKKGQDSVNGLNAKNFDGDGNETVCSDGDASDRAGSPNPNQEDDRPEASNARPNRGNNGPGRKRGAAKEGPGTMGSGDLRKKAMKNASHGGPLISERASARRQEANRSKGTTPNHSRSTTEDSSQSSRQLSPTNACTIPELYSTTTNISPESGEVDMSGEIQTSSVRDEGPEPTEGNSIETLAPYSRTTANSLCGSTRGLRLTTAEVRSLPTESSEGAQHNLSIVPTLGTSHMPNGRVPHLPLKKYRHNFFTNNAFYCLLRLLHIMYTRLYTLKKISESISTSPTPTMGASQLAENLTDHLIEPATVNAASSQVCSSSSTSSPPTGSPSKPKLQAYHSLLSSIQSLHSGQIDQSSFEEECRTLFGVKGYSVVTIDKLCQALVKVLAKLSNDETSGEILRLYEAHRQLHKASGLNGLTESQKLAYRRSVEGLTGGTDTKLFRIEWLSSVRAMRIQLLGSDDISPEDYEAVEKAWSSYMESYADMSVERTIGLGGCEVNPGFLKRNVRLVRKTLGPMNSNHFLTRSGLGVRVCMRSYRLFFSAGTYDILSRRGARAETEDEKADGIGKGMDEGEKEDGEVVEEVVKVDGDMERVRKWEKWLSLNRRLIA